MTSFLIVLAVVVVFLLVRNRGVSHVNIAQLKEAMEKKSGRVIDVREPNEFKQGHIPGAVNVPLSQLQTKMSRLPKDLPLYVYCQSGARSVVATKRLNKAGFTTYNFRGGFMRWDGKISKK